MRVTMRGLPLLLLGMIALVGFAPSELVDRQDIPVALINSSTAPIELIEATGSLLVNKPDVIGRFSAVSPAMAISQMLGWHGRIRYRNRSKQTATAVEFRWEFFDPFETTQGFLRAMRQTPLDSGQADEQEWERPASFTDVVKATLRVERVRLSDGTTWKAP